MPQIVAYVVIELPNVAISIEVLMQQRSYIACASRKLCLLLSGL